jgi:hypothetical protein
MNSGLPSLIEAIFGKNDLESVSLDELYELINEFPSFNAGHFLLSKKLKSQDRVAFEKENMRTSLYFHNAFWLQTLLTDAIETNSHEVSRQVPYENTESQESEEPFFENNTKSQADFETVIPTINENNGLLFPEPENIISEQTVAISPEIDNTAENSDRVMSFDDLILKYNIEPIASSEKIQESPGEEIKPEMPESVDTGQNFIGASDSEMVNQPQIPTEENNKYEESPVREEPFSEPPENFAEIINEYGIFEEVPVKNHDYDLEAFDRPIDIIPETTESGFVETMETEKVNSHSPAELPADESKNLNEISEPTPVISDEGDYDAFDGIDEETVEQESTETGVQKPIVQFAAKNSESIVFAPYHMVDYFASQGIKLVLEDQPKDNFGKQLKSFTDWLKVMKKIPSNPLTEKRFEKEAEKIRHFAAHSIEERDILTESMAEVLAKQGMYENAIALYQKLSLIYPPKSAYFASRIEQLKAALP